MYRDVLRVAGAVFRVCDGVEGTLHDVDGDETRRSMTQQQ